MRIAIPAFLVSVSLAGCGGGGAADDAEPTGGAAREAGGADAVGAPSNGGMAAGGGGSAGAEAAAGGTGEASGGDAGAVGTLASPPPPPTSEVPEPSAAVTSPNLRVLPWAGFRAALTYTFDDTQPSQEEHWPELEATGVPMTFFANPSNNWQSGYDATWSAVAAAGSEIGNHTWSHCHADLGDCTPVGTAEEEIDQATAYLVEHLGVPAVYSFASPYGDGAWNTYARSRFLLGRGVSSGLVSPGGTTNWYSLPVIAVTAGQTVADFQASIDGAREQGRWGIFLFHSILPTTNDWYAGVQIADITASIDYARSLGDVWVDTLVAVGAYVRAQQVFEELTPSEDTWTWTLPDHFPHGLVLRVTVDGGTLSQGDEPLAWDAHGYYEVSLDAGSLAWTP